MTETEFVANLRQTPPVECEFNVCQRVVFVNEYGVVFPDRKITGFADDDSFYGRFIHLENDAYWFPVKPSELRTCGGVK